MPFPDGPANPAEAQEIDRDLAVALRTKGEAIAVRIRPVLVDALKRHPDDLAAREALGFVFGTLQKKEQGLAEFDRVLTASPKRESTLWAAATLAGVMERPETSVAYWKRLLAVDPWTSPTHAALGHQLLALDRFHDAVAACRAALRLNPDNMGARMDLITCLVRLGSTEEAETEFATLLKLRPADEGELRGWFGSIR